MKTSNKEVEPKPNEEDEDSSKEVESSDEDADVLEGASISDELTEVMFANQYFLWLVSKVMSLIVGGAS